MADMAYALDLSPDELLTTTRAVRRRLDLDRAVELEVIKDCIEIALQAPSGSNRQGWHWVVIDDEGQRARIAEWYSPSIRGVPQLRDPHRRSVRR